MDARGIGKELDYYYSAILTSQLPLGSRVMREIDPYSGWDNTQHILVQIENDLAMIGWGLGGAKGEKPKPIKPINKQVAKENKKKKQGKQVSFNGFKMKPVYREELEKVWGK